LQPDWPADKVERRAVAALIPYARNARTHSPEQVDQIAASIREWGWTVPVLIDDEGGIIAGHGRVLAAHKLAIAEVPVMVATGWSEAHETDGIVPVEETGVQLKRILATGVAVKLSCAA
jgi:ParB-like nuclease domain